MAKPQLDTSEICYYYKHCIADAIRRDMFAQVDALKAEVRVIYEASMDDLAVSKCRMSWTNDGTLPEEYFFDRPRTKESLLERLKKIAKLEKEFMQVWNGLEANCWEWGESGLHPGNTNNPSSKPVDFNREAPARHSPSRH